MFPLVPSPPSAHLAAAPADALQIDAGFACASLQAAQALAPDTWQLSLRDDNGDPSLPPTYRAWWYVRLDQVPTDRPLRLQLARLGWPHLTVPVFSYDQVHWQPLDESQVSLLPPAGLELRAAFRQPRVWLAQHEPYPPAALHAYLAARVAPSAHARIAALELRPGVSTPVVEIGAATAQRRVWVHARAHPGEVGSSFMAEGLIDLLLEDSPAAARLRAAFLFTIVPLVGIEGAARGNYRVTPQSYNLEEMWWPDQAPPAEVAALQGRIAADEARGPPFVAALNLHASNEAPKQPPFVVVHFGADAARFGPRERRAFHQQQGYAERVGALYGRGQSMAASVGSGDDFLRRAYPESWWWRRAGERVMAVTAETVYGRDPAGHWLRPNDHRRFGRALGLALEAALALGARGAILGVAGEDSR